RVARVRTGDHVAAAAAAEPTGPYRLTHLEIRICLDDPLARENRIERADAGHTARRERPRLRSQEADRERLREARQRDLVRHLLTERLSQRDLDQIDAHGVTHEVRHLPATDPSSNLDDDHLAVSRPRSLFSWGTAIRLRARRS